MLLVISFSILNRLPAKEFLMAWKHLVKKWYILTFR